MSRIRHATEEFVNNLIKGINQLISTNTEQIKVLSKNKLDGMIEKIGQSLNQKLDVGQYHFQNATDGFPQGYTTDNDFVLTVYPSAKGNLEWCRMILLDIRSNKIFTQRRTGGALKGWVELATTDKTEILKEKVTALEESQVVQDFLIDDLVFEVIPTLEQQIDLGTSPAQDVTGVLSNRLINKGGDGMAGYLARKIIDGRDYATVFKTNAYKQYQDEVDTILELEGRSDLINR